MSGNIDKSMAGTANLLLLASLLDGADERHRAAGEPTYRQAAAAHDSGSPACALGHWCAFRGISWLDLNVEDVAAEFALQPAEARELFGGSGCGEAATSQQAASYIRQFVERRAKARA